MRGRPKNFDRHEALDKAIVLFWERGYSATGLGELTEHMGIGRQSLYNTFGDKHSLYLEALAHYIDQRMLQIAETLEAEVSPMANLGQLFAFFREEALHSRCGCMMVNSSTEMGEGDEATSRIVERGLNRLEQLFREHLERALDADELVPGSSPKALARLMLSALNGLAARSRLGLDEDTVDDVFETLIQISKGPVLGPSPS